MNISGLPPGTQIVTQYGDVVELLEATDGGVNARVRFVEVMDGAGFSVGSETVMPADDLVTVSGNRFVGPPRTSSTSKT
jgi:hypothetical protein